MTWEVANEVQLRNGQNVMGAKKLRTSIEESFRKVELSGWPLAWQAP
jgi:hypothetical protein